MLADQSITIKMWGKTFKEDTVTGVDVSECIVLIAYLNSNLSYTSHFTLFINQFYRELSYIIYFVQFTCVHKNKVAIQINYNTAVNQYNI